MGFGQIELDRLELMGSDPSWVELAGAELGRVRLNCGKLGSGRVGAGRLSWHARNWCLPVESSLEFPLSPRVARRLLGVLGASFEPKSPKKQNVFQWFS